jgi:hypothetical protein
LFGGCCRRCHRPGGLVNDGVGGEEKGGWYLCPAVIELGCANRGYLPGGFGCLHVVVWISVCSMIEDKAGGFNYRFTTVVPQQ